VALAAAGRAPAALAAADSAVRLAPDAPVTWLLLGAVQILAGRTGDAAASLDAGLARAPRSPLGLGLAGWAAARLGDAAGARAAGRRVDALGGAPGQPLALVHLRLGLRDTAGALGALERAVDLHDPMLATEPLWSSLFDEVRGSARFRAALARLGLEAAAAR
jgi:predicted Zn-dependent protease